MLKRKLCANCGAKWKLHVDSGVNHVFHFMMSVVTVGLWSIVWFINVGWRNWHCLTCLAKETGVGIKIDVGNGPVSVEAKG